MNRLRHFITTHREPLAYLFFGGVTTAVNFAVYAGLHGALNVNSDLANAAAWVIAVAVAYVTNRRWVFMSRTRGADMLREAGAFVAGRVLTGVMDMAIMHLAVEVIGPRLVSAGARKLWDMGAKLVSNALVIVLNYVFSRVWIFKRR